MGHIIYIRGWILLEVEIVVDWELQIVIWKFLSFLVKIKIMKRWWSCILTLPENMNCLAMRKKLLLIDFMQWEIQRWLNCRCKCQIGLAFKPMISPPCLVIVQQCFWHVSFVDVIYLFIFIQFEPSFDINWITCHVIPEVSHVYYSILFCFPLNTNMQIHMQNAHH
jgi:hypothetical protein